MRGILYSPVSSSLSVSISLVPLVFMDEFHDMFAMNIISVSTGYGSPRQAFEITMCIMPWAATGNSQLNALSMRSGSPSSSTSKSSGPVGKPSGGPFKGVSGLQELPGLMPGGIGFGNGGL